MKFLVIVANGWDGGGSIELCADDAVLERLIAQVRKREDQHYYLLDGALLDTNDGDLRDEVRDQVADEI